jgi:hypothetical protein
VARQLFCSLLQKGKGKATFFCSLLQKEKGKATFFAANCKKKERAFQHALKLIKVKTNIIL